MATWLVLHKKHSQYGDVIGKTYEYSIGIANSTQIKPGDFLVFCLTKKSAQGGKRILGYGEISHLEHRTPLVNDEKKRRRLAAHLINYKEFVPALSFDDLGGDPRSNKTNSINRVFLDFKVFSSEEALYIPDDDFTQRQNYARKIRRGQPIFREQLLKVYNMKCCISGHGPECVLEACHILPHSKSGINQLENGLLLRSDLHYLFDEGLLKVNPDSYTVEIDSKLSKTPYFQYNGIKLKRRTDGGCPNKSYLKIRYHS